MSSWDVKVKSTGVEKKLAPKKTVFLNLVQQGAMEELLQRGQSLVNKGMSLVWFVPGGAEEGEKLIKAGNELLENAKNDAINASKIEDLSKEVEAKNDDIKPLDKEAEKENDVETLGNKAENRAVQGTNAWVPEPVKSLSLIHI